MTPEERIALLQKRIESLARENTRFRQSQKDMHQMKKTLPEERWYVAYLQSEIAKLERQWSEQQEIIEQYQKHFKKYEHIYSDTEQV